jgi:predicted Zn-dependent peptidase
LYEKTLLQNGIRIVTEKMPFFHSVSTGIWVDVGSRDEYPHERGITHFIEHMFFKGTARRSALDIAKALDAVGGFANAFTSKEQLCLHAKVLDSHLPLVVDILLDIFLNSVFDPAEMERERQVILQEISMVEDTPDEYVHVLLQELFWKDNPLGWPIYGTVESVQGMTRENLLAHLTRTFHPSHIIIAAAGNVEHEEFVDLVGPRMERFDGAPQPARRPTPSSHHCLKVIPKDLEQVHVCMGWRSCSNLDEERFACHLLNVVMGNSMSSRLFQEIREKRALAYAVYSYVYAHQDTGMMGIYAGTGPQQLQEILDVIHEQLVRLTREPISAPELQAAKEHFKGSMYLNAESTDARVHRVTKNEFLFGRYVPFEEVEARIDTITSEGIQEWFCAAFEERHLALVLLGPVDENAVDMGQFASPAVVPRELTRP